MVSTGFEGDENAAFLQERRVFHSRHGVRFGVGAAVALVPALADDAALVGDNATHQRVGAGLAQAEDRQVEGTAHKESVVGHGGAGRRGRWGGKSRPQRMP